MLTAAILLLFLYNLRTLLIVAVTMPLTIVIGLFLMQMIGYTLNASTLIAIGMSVGILVTDSIVVVEAIASVGGILVSGVLTLVALPILYGLFTRRTAKTS